MRGTHSKQWRNDSHVKTSTSIGPWGEKVVRKMERNVLTLRWKWLKSTLPWGARFSEMDEGNPGDSHLKPTDHSGPNDRDAEWWRFNGEPSTGAHGRLSSISWKSIVAQLAATSVFCWQTAHSLLNSKPRIEMRCCTNQQRFASCEVCVCQYNTCTCVCVCVSQVVMLWEHSHNFGTPLCYGNRKQVPMTYILNCVNIL